LRRFTHTGNAIGVSLGAQTGRTFKKFSPYGYVDLLYKYKYETAEYTNLWGLSGGQFSRDINSLGARLGFGLEYNFSKRLSVILEPTLSIAHTTTNGAGTCYWNEAFGRQNWVNYNETKLNFRGVNMLVINVKF
jgi:hypothetical protein